MRVAIRASLPMLVFILIVLGPSKSAAETLREIPLPYTAFPAGVAVAPDGGVWISIMHADRLLRFDPDSNRFSEISLSNETLPRGLIVDPHGQVWFAASARGFVGRVSAATVKPREFALPSVVAVEKAAPAPWTLAYSARDDAVWFTVHSHGMLGRLGARAEPVRHGFAVREIVLATRPSRPDGIAVDSDGAIWVTEMGSDEIVRIDPIGAGVRRLALPRGSRPRGIATSAYAVWVTLFGSQRLLRIDRSSLAMKSWPGPSGAWSHPYAIAVDSHGAVWFSEYSGNTVVRFRDGVDRFDIFRIPTPNSRVQAIATDARGRVWYVGGFSGTLGVIH